MNNLLKKKFLENFVATFKEKCIIELKDKCQSISYPRRRVSYSIRDKLKQTLYDMEKRGLIKKVENF